MVVNELTNGVDIFDEINPSLSNPKTRSKTPTMKEEPAARAALASTKSTSLTCTNVMLSLVLFVPPVWDGGIVT